jgi:fimbrial chaperone protein
MRRTLCHLGRIAALFAALTEAGHAGSLDVNPVRVTLSARQRIAALTVRNRGNEPAVVQLQAQAWTQRDNTDVLTPSDALLLSPPIFTLAPGASQIIRVGLRAPVAYGTEAAFRLFLQEVPPPPDPAFKGLRMALRISLPVFVAPATATTTTSPLTWRVARAGNRLSLTAENAGDTHVHITGLALTAQTLPSPVHVGDVNLYVLPHASRTWTVDANVPAGATVHLNGQGDEDVVQADIIVP